VGYQLAEGCLQMTWARFELASDLKATSPIFYTTSD